MKVFGRSRTMRARLLMFIVPIVTLSIVTTGYFLSESGRDGILNVKQQYLFGVTRLMVDQLVQQGGYAGLSAKNATQKANVQTFNHALASATETVARAFPGVGVGYYHRELDAILTYGPAAENGKSIGKAIGPDHPGRRVMSSGQPAIFSGVQVRGNIMNAMTPIFEKDKVVGYVWANELLGDIDQQIAKMRQIVVAVTVLAILFSWGLVAWVVTRLTRDVTIITNGVRVIHTDLSQRLPHMPGEMGEIASAVNVMAIALDKAQKQERESQAKILQTQTEKMTSLTQLVTNVAHEINTPFGAVKSSGQSIAESIIETANQLPALGLMLDQSSIELFNRLVSHRRGKAETISSKNRRTLVRGLTEKLEAAGLNDAQDTADLLITLHAHAAYEDYLPLLRHPKAESILTAARSIGSITTGTDTIESAVDRVSKIVTTLRSFTKVESEGEMSGVDLQESITTVLAIYQNQIRQNTELVCEFEAVPLIKAQPLELKQVWTHLIHNALQAMGYKGKLTISLKLVGNEAVVSVTDSGSGIPDDVLPRIFEPFYSTKPQGEGSGLGLSVLKKIIEKHKGRIDVQTEVGVGSTFSVYLPFFAANE